MQSNVRTDAEGSVPGELIPNAANISVMLAWPAMALLVMPGT